MSSQPILDFRDEDEPDQETGDSGGDEGKWREHSDNRTWLVRTRPLPGGWPPSGRELGRTGGRPVTRTHKQRFQLERW